ncbi:16S rRNA (adenine(1518)-N(6)/adenine(1519)-N(6))-dimethyltransferase RsmA [Nitrospina gracilis]|uniref:16S rRNA (adenine(1518)-N(6)/adenine(1519)-N(6))- dimethyltransferase RsmA n=1 Tax=Nitrospina gracilis TaxID=35801 RepID=UPI001F01E619|nr:16S rRNA (adenine(1518)-N(6)/adenine(1519)-N(6))-dimethyltransferase RsmA [Nitrospina gracilis]MCF8719613.1 16S rRNA (adenine1518-N6/adenine1519-N6)-dimethyltransferase [Nitrospina gracilis Nb-211]
MRKKRTLGQNFLTDPAIAEEIVAHAQIEDGGTMIEIGPGPGILTGLLLERCGKLIALEIDPKLCHLLNKRFKSNPRFELHQQDALVYDYSQAGARFQVVSNLPYYAAMPILKRLIHYGSHIANMTLMLQREVVDRLVAQPGSRDYGSLTVFTQFHCEVERIMEVGKKNFDPPPKVDSSVIRLVPRSAPPVEVDNLKTFFHVVHAAFFHKRKMLKNNLKSLAKHFDFTWQGIEDAGIDPARRGETLSLEEFATLSNLMESKPQ